MTTSDATPATLCEEPRKGPIDDLDVPGLLEALSLVSTSDIGDTTGAWYAIFRSLRHALVTAGPGLEDAVRALDAMERATAPYDSSEPVAATIIDGALREVRQAWTAWRRERPRGAVSARA